MMELADRPRTVVSAAVAAADVVVASECPYL